jgi:hypothetical protein
MAMVAALAAPLAFAAAARADVAMPPEAHDAVPGHPGVTYLDLLRQVIPNLADNAANHDVEGQLEEPVRNLGGKAFEGVAPDPVVVGLIEDVRFKAGGKDRIAIMADLGPDPDRAYNAALLALYDDAAKPKLLDFADVGLDREVSFSFPGRKLALGPGDDALITYSEHSNSGQGYQSRLLVFVRNGRLRLIGYLFLLWDQGCGWTREETPTWSTRPDPGSPYPEIDVAVSEVLTSEDVGCDQKPPRAYSRTWRGSWRWNAAKRDWVAGPGDLRKLDKLNQKRLG